MNYSAMQLQAINESGQNILVSAGAGSGKTSVLTARVINLLKKGIHIDELLILTFTNAAAKEMKERIRNSISQEATLQDELLKLDESFICTFDSFALFLVKKYHYLLNLPSNPKITDNTLIDILQKECMREIFDSYYTKEDVNFLKLVDTFCVKDDDNLLNEFLNIAKKLELKLDIEEYLDNYLTNYYSDEFFAKLFNDYEQIVLSKIKEIASITEEISFIDRNYFAKLNDAIQNLLGAQSYEEAYLLSGMTLPRLSKDASLELKDVKENLNNTLSDLKELLRFGSQKDLKEDYFNTKNNTTVLINILKDYFALYEEKKELLGYYDFTKIFKIAYYLVKNNSNILNEVKKQFKEIMVDEYQDTNDLEEAFINLISQDNVYMVGDIKQSIYRFRNANPNLFKEKYNLYKEKKNGYKIDLIDNFRSRKEVLTNINLLFNPLMSDNLGGANYYLEHQMVFGNKMYEECKDNLNYDMEIVNYQPSKEYLNEEIEAFYIANDIKKKVLNEEKIVSNKTLRKVKYEDFCILMDRGSNFPLYQKIFNYLGVPIHAYYDEQIKSNVHFQTLKNAFLLINKMVLKVKDDDYKMAFVTLARGFLFNLSDEEIYNIVTNNLYEDSIVVKTLKPIIVGIDSKPLNVILDEIIETTNYYEKIITIGNINDSMILIDYFKNFVFECTRFGYTYEDFVNYLNNLVDYKLELKYRAEKKSDDCVKLMNIHTSKGLEFPICYYSGLYKRFNLDDIKEQFLYSKKYGLVCSIDKEGLYPTFVKELVKNDFYTEEISEKIRLFYVALTRSKEKMIFILPHNDKDILNSKITDSQKLKARSFADFLNLLKKYYQPYLKEMPNINISKAYLTPKTKELKKVKEDKLNVLELVKDNTLEEQKTFSKKINELATLKEIENMKLGTKFHETLQYLDFKNPRLDLITDEFIKTKIKAFLNSEIIKNSLTADIYHEYEFIWEDEEELLHGIMDLLIVKDSEILIIDYKLQNVSSKEYLNQLKGYKNYVIKTFKKPVKTYLYSITNEAFKLLDI